MSKVVTTHWASAKAEDYCLSVRDGTHDSPKFVETGYPLVTSRHISDGRLSIAETNLISESDFEEINKRSKVDQWDLLFTMIGTLGEVYLVSDEEPKFAIKNVGLFKCGDELKARWLYYWFRNPATRNSLLQQRRGASQQYLPLGTLRALPIAYPTSSATMQEIVDRIAQFDEFIDNNRRRISLLEEAARLLYREWFVHFRFPGHEHVTIKDGLPEGWQRKPLGAVLNLQRGFDLPVGDRVEGDVPVYGSTGIVGHHDTPKVLHPTLITGRSGSLGTVSYVEEPCWPLNTSLWVTDFKEGSIYLAYFILREMSLANFGGGASVPTLDRKVVHAVPVVIPASKLSVLFEEYVRPLFAEKRVLGEMNARLAQARDLLLPRLMSGEIAV